MKKLFLILAILLFSLSSEIVYAGNLYSSYSLILIKVYNEKPDYSDPPKDKGRRTPARPIACTISEDEGITTNVVIEDIETYELWDIEGEECIAVYANDIDAASHLLSTPGEYQLRIITNEYSYIGYITTL